MKKRALPFEFAKYAKLDSQQLGVSLGIRMHHWRPLYTSRRCANNGRGWSNTTPECSAEPVTRASRPALVSSRHTHVGVQPAAGGDNGLFSRFLNVHFFFLLLVTTNAAITTMGRISKS